MALGPTRWMLLQLLRATPKNFMSRVAGWLARIALPQPLRRWQIRWFGRIFGVNFDEVRDPIDSFKNVQAFFVRELKDGARPIDADPDSFVSPCDGAWGTSGVVERGQILQVKGKPYALARLLGSEQDAARFEGGAFVTLYLSPKDYHRFHAPCDAVVERARYLPGTLWPVNGIGVYGVDGLFAENERIVALCQARDRALALVPVGATMVGKVHVTFDDLTTNAGQARIEREYPDGRCQLARGEQWGRFEFGSTIVVVTAPGLVDFALQPPGTPVVMGRPLGRMVRA